MGTRQAAVARRLSAAIVATLLVTVAVRSPARAQVELTPGSGGATATVAGLNIPYGGANLGIDVGQSNASFFELTAKASAVTLEPAIIRIANVLKACGGDFTFPIPDPTLADTNAAGGRAATGHKDLGAGVGVEDASAAPGSRSASSVTAGQFGIPGLLDLSGGVAKTSTELDQAGQARSVRAEVRTGTLSLVGGLVEIEGMRWLVAQRAVGPDSRTLEVTEDTSFSIGAVRLAGLPLPVATAKDLETTIASLNQMLQPMGLQLRLPRLVPNGANGREYTPFQVALGGDTAAAPLYPLISGGGGTSLVDIYNAVTQPAIVDPVGCNSLAGLLKASPEVNQVFTTIGIYAPVILSAFAAALGGGAELNINVGGARTTFDASYYAARIQPAALSPTSSPPTGSRVGAVPPAVTPSTSEVALGTPEKVSTTCRSTSPVGRPGCWKGLGPIAATLAAVVALGLFVTDETLRRRRSRLSATGPEDLV